MENQGKRCSDNQPHFTPDGKLTDAGRAACERMNNLTVIEARGVYDMALIETYPDESIAYIAHQIRREDAASRATAGRAA